MGFASATISSRSPGLASSAASIAWRSSSLNAFAAGERHVPSSCTTAHTSPPALKRLTTSVSWSATARVASRGPALKPAHDAAALDHALEHAELGVRDRLAEVRDLQREPRVRLVGAVAQHRLVVAQPRPRRRRRREAGLLEHAPQQALDRAEDVLLLDEAHLEVELGELGLAVGAQVLVAEAAGDLVVALVAAHHQQLLEQLRRLRQRVERARAQPRGHEEVARALGRRLREDRRLDLEEVVRVQVVAHRPVDDVARDHRVAHVLPAQVEHPVAQPDHLVDRAVLVDRERRRQRVRQVLGVRDRDLDLAGLEVRVDVALLAADDLAGRGQHVLGPQLLGERERRSTPDGTSAARSRSGRAGR